MSTNISKKKRDDLLDKIKQIRAFIAAAPQDENTGNLLSYLSELEKDVNGKKYGLVFEEHREEIDEVLDTHTPVLTEEADLFIDHGGQMNFLLEGDNLAALKLLEKTHRGKIDLIYIDPPYNTGNKDLKDYIGASTTDKLFYNSDMLEKLRCGIVVHHGSMPLTARLILEHFTQQGFCKICFATSTLEQGINMPFDVVYLDRFEESKTLSVKNLIGRAGRSTAKPIFDFGSVILRPNAMSRFRKVYQKKNILSSKSRLDITDDKMDEKYEEYKEAIKTGEFSDEYNLTNKDLEKLKSDSVTTVVPTLLDMMFTGADFVLPNAVAKEVYEDFQCLYKQYLGRELTAAEKYVFDSAIKIMIWKVHGKTFSKICQERYAYVSNVAQRRFLAKAGQQNRADNLPVRYIAGYSDIPDKELRAYPLFPVGTKGKDVDYDRIVYDTYDFLDKLIGFKLSDLFYAIFHQYYLAYQDNRAERLAKYIKYGTEDSTEIWMLRYGFSFEEIEWLKPCVESIDQTEIRFNGEIESLDDFQRSSIAQYLF